MHSTAQCSDSAHAGLLVDADSERDYLFTLLAYAVVHKDWQYGNQEDRRGFNIGAVLVDKQHRPVFWATNAIHKTANRTQHAEVRLMSCFLAGHPDLKLDGYQIYTTLEPCAMCAGMMHLTGVKRAVYGQSDPAFGGAIERLQLDSRAVGGGFGPYPRSVLSACSNAAARVELDRQFSSFMENNPDADIVTFLDTEQAEQVFAKASEILQDYQLKFTENRVVLENIRLFYRNQVADEYVALCPAM